MSKKNKAKFKGSASRRIKNHVLEQITQVKSEPIVSSTNIQPDTSIPSPSIKAANATFELQNLPQIKTDLIKTAIVMVILILIIVTLAITDPKYHELVNFGSWLFRALHIQ